MTQLTLQEQFWQQVNKNTATGCWEWEGQLVRGTKGIFTIYHGEKREYILADRFAYESLHGPTHRRSHPIVHTCKNLLCVNPDHLQVITTEDKFWSQVKKQEGNQCWPWTGILNNKGYAVFVHEGKREYAHRYIFCQTFGPLSPKLEVCHTCDNPQCVRLDHLFLGTHHENMQDKKQKGRCRSGGVKGEQNPSAKITELQAREIKHLLTLGLTAPAIVSRLHVTLSSVYEIKRGRSWRWIS